MFLTPAEAVVRLQGKDDSAVVRWQMAGCVQQAGTWSSCLTFTIITPTISSISPSSGVPETQVTINGTNFGSTQGSGQVWLGSTYAGSIVSWSNTQIVATVASGAVTGTAQVQQGGVWDNYGTFTVITPNLTSISPTSGPVGTQVTFTRTGFGTTQGSGKVWLANKYATIVSWSDTQVVATVIGGSSTSASQVYQNGVWSNTITFTVTPFHAGVPPLSGDRRRERSAGGASTDRLLTRFRGCGAAHAGAMLLPSEARATDTEKWRKEISMTLQRRHVLHLAAIVLSIASARVLSAQVQFNSIPVSNTCPEGHSLQPVLPLPPCPGLLPGGSNVFNCVLETLIGTLPYPPYLTAYDAAGGAIINPPSICYFHGCSLWSVTLDCFTPIFAGDAVQITNRQVIHFKQRAMPTEQPAPPSK